MVFFSIQKQLIIRNFISPLEGAAGIGEFRILNTLCGKVKSELVHLKHVPITSTEHFFQNTENYVFAPPLSLSSEESSGLQDPRQKDKSGQTDRYNMQIEIEVHAEQGAHTGITSNSRNIGTCRETDWQQG